MWLLTALLLWVPACGQTHTAKSVITLEPPWVSVFPEDRVTLRCEGPHVPGDNATQWFLNGTATETLTANYSIAAASADDAGEYRCQGGASVPSDPVRLEVHRDWLLLQVSSRVVIEGKPLALRCRRWKDKKVFNILFYHNNKTFKFSPWNPKFTIPKTNLSHSGIYHCQGNKQFTSAGVSITVQELFPAPVLRASSPSPLREGDPVSLSCDTRVLPHSPPVRLSFSFYTANKTLVNGTASPEYQLGAARREDAGFYWCEAATEDGNVIKHSPAWELQVLGLQETPTPVWVHGVFYLVMAIIFLVNTVLCVIIHKKLHREKTWSLDIPLESAGQGKKVISYS